MARKWVPTPVVGGATDGLGYRDGEDAAGMIAEERELWYEARTQEEKAEIERRRDERRHREAKERERQAWPSTQAGQLLKQLGEVFAAYRNCVAQDPRLEEKGLEFDELNQKIFNRMKTNKVNFEGEEE